MQSRLSGTYKRNAFDCRMLQKEIRLLMVAGNQVDHACGKPGFLQKLRHAHAGHGGNGGGFQNQCVPGCNTHRHHPAHRDHSREIKRRNAGEYAHRFTVKRSVEPGGSVHQGFPHHDCRRPAGHLHRFLDLQNIAARFIPIFAVFMTDKIRQFVHMPIQQVAEAVKYLHPFEHGRLRPCRERLFRSGHRLLHFFPSAAGNFCQHFSRRRVHYLFKLRRFGFQPFPACKIFQCLDF